MKKIIDNRNKKNHYDIYGLAVKLAESVGDSQKIEYYKRKRGEALELGFVIDIFDALWRGEI